MGLIILLVRLRFGLIELRLLKENFCLGEKIDYFKFRLLKLIRW